MLIFIFTTLTFMYLDFILCFMGIPWAFSQPHTKKNPTRAPGVLLHYKHTWSPQLLNFNACCNYCLHFALMGDGVKECSDTKRSTS